MLLRAALLFALLGGDAGFVQQAPAAVDTSTIGPRVGTVVPPIAGVDQFGNAHTLASIAGPKGAMVVFFRSADW